MTDELNKAQDAGPYQGPMTAFCHSKKGSV